VVKRFAGTTAQKVSKLERPRQQPAKIEQSANLVLNSTIRPSTSNE
jgi:hypothetical protein